MSYEVHTNNIHRYLTTLVTETLCSKCEGHCFALLRKHYLSRLKDQTWILWYHFISSNGISKTANWQILFRTQQNAQNTNTNQNFNVPCIASESETQQTKRSKFNCSEYKCISIHLDTLNSNISARYRLIAHSHPRICLNLSPSFNLVRHQFGNGRKCLLISIFLLLKQNKFTYNR